MKTGKILSAAFCAGRRHDFQLFKESGAKLPPHALLPADAGCQGMAGIHPKIQTSFRKTKLQPLDKEQTHCNKTLSRKRIVIEHIFRKLKVFSMLSERYRNRKKHFGLRFNLIAAIYNMELTIAYK